MAEQEGPAIELVAAIDFGTTYSGYAYALTSEYSTNRKSMKILCNNWHSGGRGLMSQKTPTTVLIDDTEEFDSFGYDAENKYSELAEQEDHMEYFYFRRFKMELFKNTTLTRETVIYDIRNKPMKALKVFAMCIQYLKKDLMKMLKTRGLHVDDRSIHWVLTVPAIWDDSAKQFMREAAQKAGIEERNLSIALEPEAASLFCQELPVEKLHGGEGIRPFAPGSKYMVLDAGGGTVDITVHEVEADGSLKELHKASGGDWGGTRVDEEYKKMLTSFTQQDTMDKFCKANTAEFVDLYREFETKKRSITRENHHQKLNILMPIALKDVYEEQHPGQTIHQAIQTCPYGTRLQWRRDKLQMGPGTFSTLFGPACNNIVKHVQKLLDKPTVRGTEVIIMVGGFSESFVLQSKIRESFPHITVIIPEEAGLAVLKGAVLFGLNPDAIASRIAKYTYGFKVVEEFDSTIHDVNKKEYYDGILHCKDIFSKHVEKHQALRIGEAQAERTYTPLTDDQTAMTFAVYTSKNADPMYVTDPKCRFIGRMTVEMPDTTGGKMRKIKARMIFGGTEIKVEAREVNTGNVTSARFNFLD